ncbi:NINE protein [Streptomyces sp. NPDC051776]|uniref:NINE protein n=1 Tax=Streptomyces sp. NPDC051776 TaxID=3155414 RepID=UPI00344366C9
MALLGERNWTVPRWLRWLPHISHGEGEAELALAGTQVGAAGAAAGAVRSAPAAYAGQSPYADPAPCADDVPHAGGALSQRGWDRPGHGPAGATATGHAGPPQNSPGAPPRQRREPSRDVPAAPDPEVSTRHLSTPRDKTAYEGPYGGARAHRPQADVRVPAPVPHEPAPVAHRRTPPPGQTPYDRPGPEWAGQGDRGPYPSGVPRDTARGERLAPNGLPYSPKSKNVAGVLQLLLGFLGVGRFYTGHIWTGIAMVLTAGGGMIWALIDAIMYFVTSDRTDKKGRILHG